MAVKLQAAAKPVAREWQYLSSRPGRRKQLFVMGTRLPAARVWGSIQTEGYSFQQAALAWDIPVEAVEESVRYCRENEALLVAEAAAERARLEAKGYRIEPPPAR